MYSIDTGAGCVVHSMISRSSCPRLHSIDTGAGCVVHSMISRSSCPRLHLFSGHDTTLVPLLKGIGAWNDVWPPYSSDLAFELYEDSSGDHLVKIVYNGQVVFNFRSRELVGNTSTTSHSCTVLSRLAVATKMRTY